jgi:paraquat-inducible protein B
MAAVRGRFHVTCRFQINLYRAEEKNLLQNTKFWIVKFRF